MRTVIITIKRNGYIYFKFMFSTKNMVWVIKSTIAMRRFFEHPKYKTMVANRAYTFKKFCLGLHEFQKSKWFRIHAPTQHFYTSNHRFVVTTMQQQTSFFTRNDTYVKLLYLKRKNEIGIYIRCNYHTTTDFFHHNKWYHCKAYIFEIQKVSDSKVPYQWDGSFGHPKYKTMVANMATMFTIFVNVYTDSRNRIIPL